LLISPGFSTINWDAHEVGDKNFREVLAISILVLPTEWQQALFFCFF
jgi:hypothetical protein